MRGDRDGPGADLSATPGLPDVRRGSLTGRVGALVGAIRENDERAIETRVRDLSARHRLLAPLAFAVGAIVLLFDGLRLLLSNWRLALVQVLPAMLIWLAMYDLKAHVLHGKSFAVISGAVLIPIWIVILAISVGSFFLNAVFAFAIARPGRPEVRPAVAEARRHLTPIAIWGAVIGALLAFATTVATREPHPWFTLSLSVVIGLMMLCYVTVPARLIGVNTARSPHDRLVSGLIGGMLGATVCTPPYLLGRVGLLMLGGATLLRIPGLVIFLVGFALQSGATGAVRAIKMSMKLTSTPPGRRHRRKLDGR